MSTNYHNVNPHTDKQREIFQKNDSKRNNNSRENPIEAEMLRQKNRDKQMRRLDAPDNNRIIRPAHGGSIGSLNNHSTTFEIYKTHTLVTKVNPQNDTKPVKLAPGKPRPNLFQSPQPSIIYKQHYNNSTNSSESNLKITRYPNNNPEEKRSMSAVVKGHSRGEPIVTKSAPLKPLNQPINQKPPIRIVSASNKPNKSGNNSNNNYNYDSLTRDRSKSIDQANDPNLIYYSLPRSKTKAPVINETKHSSKAKPIGIIIPHKKQKISIDESATLAADSSDTNPINFSSTLAKAATNSPPVKRRLSFINSPNSRMPARFASRNTIHEIYFQKNYKEYQEKYKKAASEILKENLALKFGPNATFLNQATIEAEQMRDSFSSTVSSSSTSSGTDQQISISSIPHDDIPLGIPNKNEIVTQSKVEDSNKTSVNGKHVNKVEEMTEIMQGMVVFDQNIEKNADLVHLSDEDNDDYEEYDLDDEQTTSGSASSGSNEDIENLKKKFIPLYEIERMDDDFALSNEGNSLPDHLHSQSFRVENTSIASNTEVFVYKESLQRAKDALKIEPTDGILSVKLNGPPKLQKQKRRAIFDPHILLLDACLEPDFELAKELIPKVPNISKKTIDGITALHNAVCSSDPKLVLFLLESGADVNASDADGWTPLHCSACCNNKQISKLLVEHGASLFSMTLSDYEIPSQKCNKANQEDTQCEEYLFWEQENLGIINSGIVYAIFYYEPQRSDELQLVPNQILKILDTNPTGETGWFLAEDLSQIVSSHKKGFVPAAYVSVYQLTLPQKQSDLIYRS